MRSERQHQIDRAVIRSLRDVGGRLVPQRGLRDSVAIKVDFLGPSVAEIDDSIRHLEGVGYILGTAGETSLRFKITGEGEAWAMEHKL